MWMRIILLGLVCIWWGDGEGLCRVSESTLFCTGRWDGISREGITEVVIREWDRRWCGAEVWEKVIIYGRGCTCESIRVQCKATPFSVTGKECQERTREEFWTTGDHQTTVQLAMTTGDQTDEQFTMLVTGSTTVTERPETWAYAWIGTLGGLCVILVCVVVYVCQKKKLFFLCLLFIVFIFVARRREPGRNRARQGAAEAPAPLWRSDRFRRPPRRYGWED